MHYAMNLMSGEFRADRRVEAVADEHLVRAAQRGDRVSFADLVERHYAMVFACAWRRLRNRADAEDVAQEVMAKFGQAIFSLKEPGALRGFLLKLAVNAVTDQFRRTQRDMQRSAEFLADPSVKENDESDERYDQLWIAVRRLPDQQREAVTLVYGDGASHREAAEAMGCAEATISYHVHAARKRLKELLKEGDA
jgi:RNA polymerase sigma-70 factor, ECF subfamily